MDSVSDVVEYAIGVDTHRDTNVAAVLQSPTGAVLLELTVSTNRRGHLELLDQVRAETADAPRVWAIEGCGSYGAGLCRLLTAEGEWVVEVERPGRPKRQSPAKDDQIDAIRAGRLTLGSDLDDVVAPRVSSLHDQLTPLLMARHGAVEASTAAACQLHAGIVSAPDRLRDRFVGLSTTRRLTLARGLRPSAYNDPIEAATAAALRSIALRHQSETRQAKQLHKLLENVIAEHRPDVLEISGVGPIVAATVLCAWSHPGRFENDGNFAMLAGTAPIPVSSGSNDQVRLNPGGDRKLNHAIHTIVLSRLRWDPETIAYRDKRRIQGKTDRATRRCLKRYITRQPFRQLENPT